VCCRYDVFYDFCSVLLEVVQMGGSGAERERASQRRTDGMSFLGVCGGEE